MGPGFEPETGIRAMLSGTPNVLGIALVEEGAKLVAEAGLDAIRAKAIELTTYAVELADSWLDPLGVTVASPRDAAERGAHVSLRHPDAQTLCVELAHRGVITDFRTPDIIRVGLSPLTTGFTDVWHGLDALRDLLSGPTAPSA
jgi:kynureninase